MSDLFARQDDPILAQPLSHRRRLSLDESDRNVTPPAARLWHHGDRGHAEAISQCILGKNVPSFPQEEEEEEGSCGSKNVGQLANRGVIILLN